MIFLKIILIICILEISTKIGFILSSKFNKRLKEYLIIEDILIYIESKIKYSQENLMDIFKQLSIEYKDNNFGKLFMNINHDLVSNNYTLYEAFSNNIEKSKNMFSCDLDILLQLAKNLGNSDVEDQIKNISLLKDRIKILIKNSKIIKEKNEKLYRNLGIICGLTIAIILM